MTEIPSSTGSANGTSRTWSVAEVNGYVRKLMESDANLQDLWVEGEISNLSRPRSGHVYFTLKDQDAALRCVMWRSAASRLRAPFEDGDAVEVHGSLSVYEVRGQYQLYVDDLRPRGAGSLYQEFLRLKDQLEGEGLFDPEHKLPLPDWPKRIGIVTSPSAAALQDMLNTLRRRYPLVEVVLSPTSVQGEAAPMEIVSALSALLQRGEIDLILLGRGGGSIEDLWAFNDERVARAVYSSSIPVISGVGHETDFTITDFAADRRAPTPTAAAELAVPDQVELRASLREFRMRLARTAELNLGDRRSTVRENFQRLVRVSPQAEIRMGRQRVDEMGERLVRAVDRRLTDLRKQVGSLEGRLANLNPLAVLERGYAVVSREDGSTVYRVDQVEGGEPLQVRVTDGTFEVLVSGD